MKGSVKRNSPESIEMTKSMLKLYKLYNDGATLDEVGQQFGMTRQAVRDRFERLQLGRHPPKYQTIEKKKLLELYIKKYLLLEDIARTFSTSPETIERSLKYHRIKKRPGQKKIGGFMVDFLRSLKIGESKSFECPPGKNPRIDASAKRIGIKIKCSKEKKGTLILERIS